MGDYRREVPLAAALAFGIISGAHQPAPPPATPVRRAMLVGIDKYVPPPSAKTAGGRDRSAWTDLEGAVNDVDALHEVLISRFGFKDADVHVLTDADATRDAVVSGIRKWLIQPAAAGDVSFFFYAGHGSQVRNSKSTEADRMDETIVLADANRGQPDLRDKELARLFGEALDKHVVLTLGFDSCHSGSIARGIHPPMKFRLLPPDPRDAADPSAAPPLEDRGALVFSAAQEDQLAGETSDDEHTPHGLFTWALLKTLRTMPVDEPMDRVFLRVRSLMQSVNAAQEPVLAGIPERRRAAMFGSAFAGSAGFGGTGSTIVAVQAIDGGSVVLQGGLAAGIRAGAELRKVGETAPVLRVIEERGLTHSLATVVAGGSPSIGDLFAVVKWAAPSQAALRVYVDPDPALNDVAAALRFDRTGSSAGVEKLTSAKDADYILSARRAGSTVECAWVRPFTTDEAPPMALPARSTWLTIEPGKAADVARQLEQSATELAVVRTWLQLESPPDSEAFPYRLALKNAASGETIAAGPIHDGETYGLVMSLVGADAGLARRYIYVFDIQSNGAITMLFPRRGSGNVENRLPAARGDDGRLPMEIALGAPDRLIVRPPFGVDTLVMLTTDTALPDPEMLEGKAVQTRALTAADPLSRLLAAAASGKRSEPVPTPTNWSIDRITIETVARQGR